MDQVKQRIDQEERARAEDLAPLEAHMRAEIRARVREEMAHYSHSLSYTASSSGVSHGRSLDPVSSSMYENDAYQLRRKIARLEGEQRVDMSAAREGELEAARFELREMHMMR